MINFINQLSLKYKIQIIPTFLSVFLLLTVIVMTFLSLSQLHNQSALGDVAIKKGRTSSDILLAFSDANRETATFLSWISSGIQGKIIVEKSDEIASKLQNIQDLIADLKSNFSLNEQELELHQTLSDQAVLYQTATNEVIEAGLMDVSMAMMFVNGSQEKVEAVQETLQNFDALIQKNITEQTAQMEKSAFNQQVILLSIVVIFIIVFFVLGYFVARLIYTPMLNLSDAMLKITDGDFNTEIPHQDLNDEVGKISRAANMFKTSVQEREAEQKEAQAVEHKRMQDLQNFIKSFESSVSQVMDNLVASANQIKEQAVDLKGIAQELDDTSDRAISASQDSFEGSNNVSQSSQELRNAIAELSRNMNDTSVSANLCTEYAVGSRSKLESLQNEVNQVVEIITYIEDIAEKTNLLALNATIESARAGEAGRGFSVVANEVKQLATNTKTLTSDVSEKVASMKGVTEETAHSLISLIEKIDDVNQQTVAISAAIEEQNAATDEIARSTATASKGSKDANDSMNNVKQAIQRNIQISEGMENVSHSFEEKFSELNDSVSAFLKNIQSV